MNRPDSSETSSKPGFPPGLEKLLGATDRDEFKSTIVDPADPSAILDVVDPTRDVRLPGAEIEPVVELDIDDPDIPEGI